MAKSSKSSSGVFTNSKKDVGDSARPGRIEIQRGNVDLDEQFTQGFRVRSETTKRDMDDLVERRWGQTMIEETPKR